MRNCLVVVSAALLSSCASLQYIHDPQFGFLNSDQAPDLLKSVRCELITFYAANAARKDALDWIAMPTAVRAGT
jgi:hypothetical protein